MCMMVYVSTHFLQFLHDRVALLSSESVDYRTQMLHTIAASLICLSIV